MDITKALEPGHRERFSNEYKEIAFQYWYKSDRPAFAKLERLLPPDEYGRVAGANPTLMKWAKEGHWVERADEMDKEVVQKLNADAITAKVEVLRRQADLAREVEDKSMKYFREHEMTSTKQAITALFSAMKVERDAVGIPQALTDFSKKSDKQLIDTVYALLDKVQSSDIPTSDSEETEDIIDVDFEDLSEAVGEDADD